ncbi:hypothetical protein EV140_2013 [Microcella alkaliphila]|uniref:Uncharacterized protein n=1 Tax=Microcella alkaliphila TaxID=279828 RepID=A0A4Q7THG6_9MICO|nr:hypothetical protein [Microcella alkaliphila]RZT59407.1 hypothetical protein EV140_2013 [Microcella alkaliphila]
MTNAATPTPTDAPVAAPRKGRGRVLYVASAVGAAWLLVAVIWSVTSAFSSVGGAFSFFFLFSSLTTAVTFLPLMLVSVGIPAVVALIVGSVVARRVHALWVRGLVIASAGMTAFVVPIALTWRGNEWDQGLVPTYIAMTVGAGLLLSLSAVLPWRGGFASRRYDPAASEGPGLR